MKGILYKTIKVVMINLVMTKLVLFNKALADATRWRIVSLVTDEALCICELADILEMPQSTISSHVQIIRKAGLLESEKCEKWTYFRIEKKYLRLIRSMSLLFAEPEDPSWKDDARKAQQRLAQREDSCCPGPQNLSPRKKTQTKTLS